MVDKFVRKPIEIEALKWDGQNHREMWEFLGGNPDDYMTNTGKNFYIDHSKVERGLIIRTSDGDTIARVGDYIIKEPFGKERKYYPCKSSVFELTYEITDDNFENRKIVAAQLYALNESNSHGAGSLTRIKTAWENGFDTCLQHQEEFINKSIDFGFEKCKEFGDITKPERNDFIQSLKG